jgi:hypothetical protein
MTNLSTDQGIASDEPIRDLPPAVRAAIEQHDAVVLQCVLDELPAEQAQKIMQQLEKAGIISIGPAPDAELQKMLLALNTDNMVTSIPEAVLSAIQAQDENAFQQAMEQLSPADRQFVAAQLAELQIQADAEAEAWLMRLPIDVRLAIQDQDEQRLQAALHSLPPSQAQEILEQLEAARLLEETVAPEADLLMAEFEPLILAVASVAKGNEAARPQLEALLTDLDGQGWHLSAAVQRIWAGERELQTLCKGLDRQDQQIVRCILDHLG